MHTYTTLVVLTCTCVRAYLAAQPPPGSWPAGVGRLYLGAELAALAAVAALAGTGWVRWADWAGCDGWASLGWLGC